ncbi:hypothetical protein CTM88_06700 [Photobacterium aquimaris]|uniref:Uncharacterized protein n=1 Tax=Photobacterium aquimaris TaxID=512643 RepID=A0A2T3IMR5_9GAMM|nr:hypothetical protein AYY20_07740 [Photobacterium aquimaris]PSU29635.1 hypothetical protein CTM88_06700 [Photobacterium aquimaris]
MKVIKKWAKLYHTFKRIEREEYNKLHILYRDKNELIINTPDGVITYTNKGKTNPNSQHILF